MATTAELSDLDMLVALRSDLEVMENTGLFHLLFDDAQPKIELGYHLHKKFWGKGYGTELARALIHGAFSIDQLINSFLLRIHR